MAVVLRNWRLRHDLPNVYKFGLECCSMFNSAASLQCHTSEVSCNTGIRSEGLIPGGSPHGKQKLLWEDLFTKPSEWWDNRLDKKGPEHPDFQHRVTGEVLWLTDQHKPAWVESRLGTLDAQLRAVQWPTWNSLSVPGEQIINLCETGQLEKALDVLGHRDQQGSVATASMYTSLFKACAKRKDLAQAKQVHAYFVKHGLDSTGFLGEFMVSTFVQCGGLGEALQVFHSLPQRTVFSWTAVISGYTTAGNAHEALRMYQHMQEEGLEPNGHTFVSLLKACGSIGDLKEGKRIHAEVLKYRCEHDVFVGSCLIDMYAKCGSTADARNVFDGLFQRNVVSWNAMLAAYAQQGEPEKALELYDFMQEEGTRPSNRTFVSAVHACGILADKEEGVMIHGRLTKAKYLKRGRALHADAEKKGCSSDVFVGNTLVSMYGKCGSIEDAWDVFDALPRRDVVSWNAMLTAFLQQGPAEKALQLYEQMLEKGVNPNSRTFASALQACAMVAENAVVDGQVSKEILLDKGRAIHADARRKGYHSAVFVANTLISMYSKCGSISEAQTVFDGLSNRDIVSWNTLLVVYVEEGQPEKTLQLYEKMREESVSPDIRTFMTCLHACALLAEKEEGCVVDGQLIKVKSLERGKAILEDACTNGCDADIFVQNTLISMYGKCGRIVDAEDVFGALSNPNVVAWNALLAAYIHQGHLEKALNLYDQMGKEGVNPNGRTFASALQACCLLAEKEAIIMQDGRLNRENSLEKGKAIHRDARITGWDSDAFVGNSLISMYGKCGSIGDALDVFDTLVHRNVVSWNSMLAAYSQQGQPETALDLYEQMLEEGYKPNDRTFVTALQACCILADKEDMINGLSAKDMSLEKGKGIHATAQEKGYASDIWVGSTLISMYGKCGNLVEARKVFDALYQRSVVAWNAMLSAYVGQGQGDKALQLFREMQEEGVSPNDITRTCISRASSDTGSWESLHAKPALTWLNHPWSPLD